MNLKSFLEPGEHKEVTMFRQKVESKLQSKTSEREYGMAMEIVTDVIRHEFKKGVKEDHAAMLVAFCINRMRTFNLEY